MLAAAAGVAWIRILPLSLESVAPALRGQLEYHGDDGRAHVFLGDLDSYVWLRNARNYLRTGTTCDSVVGGQCRDLYTNAPVGVQMRYNRSLHIAAIIAVHRLLTTFRPGYPLAASAYWVPVVIGTLGVLPAFAVGWQLAGVLGGLCSALVCALDPMFLYRSAGSDNDVWNVVLPLYMVWAVLAALSAAGRRRQIAYALLAGGCTGLYAATWDGWVFTYGVLLAGLLLYVVMRAARYVRRTGSTRFWEDASVTRAGVVLLTFYIGAGVVTTLARWDNAYFAVPLQRMTSILHGEPITGTRHDPDDVWPDVFATVGELKHPTLSGIAAELGGNAFFFSGWLGMLVLVLPRRRWQWWHFLILIGGNYLYRYLLTAPSVGRTLLIALLALPVATTMLLYVMADSDSGESDQGLGLIVVVWFLASLLVSYGGRRYVMLAVPPFAIAFAVAVGRLQQWLASRIVALAIPWAAVVRALVTLVLAAVIIRPVQRGYAAARSYVPQMNQAWWTILTRLRDESPPDAIIHAWWDYGYWIKYVAERRVSADGGSLATHIPYWLGRALVATDEGESVGIFRMLDCGSDATPEPEGQQGAYGKLLKYGRDAIAAQSMVVALASLDRAAAETYLAAKGMDAAGADDILASTHCQPPPAYLVLTSDQIAAPAWQFFGSWDLRRAYVAHHTRFLPEDAAFAELTGVLGYEPERARDIYDAAHRLRSDAAVRRFIAGDHVAPAWASCTRPGDGSLVCPITTGTAPQTLIASLASPADTRIRFGGSGGSKQYVDRTPGVVLVAGAAGIEEVPVSSPTQPQLGVLIDATRDRVLVGTPQILRSVFTQLMFLDGRYLRDFEKYSEQTGFRGERVVAWKIRWPQSSE